MIEIKEISASETYPIRLEVLRKNIPLPVAFNGDNDPDTFHLGAYLRGRLVAVSSFMHAGHPDFRGDQYQLRGMATLPESRGEGAGKHMMKRAFEILSSREVDVLWCNARLVALEFYKKMGMTIAGERFVIEPIGDHYVMVINKEKYNESI